MLNIGKSVWLTNLSCKASRYCQDEPLTAGLAKRVSPDATNQACKMAV